MALLEVKDLHTSFFTDAGEVRAVNGVSFNLERGKVLGIVGESGSGKSVTAYSIMQILVACEVEFGIEYEQADFDDIRSVADILRSLEEW